MRLSPSVRRAVQESGVDPASLTGSGKDGRITKEDVARVIDVGPETLVFEVVGEPEELDSFEELVRPHGIRELARTGRIGDVLPGVRGARVTLGMRRV